MDATTKFFLLCAYPDLAFDGWITVNGAHVETDKDGSLKGSVGAKISGGNNAPKKQTEMSKEDKKFYDKVEQSKAKLRARGVPESGIEELANLEIARYEAKKSKKQVRILEKEIKALGGSIPKTSFKRSQGEG